MLVRGTSLEVLSVHEEPGSVAMTVTSPRITDTERYALVWERRLRGMSYEAIARDLVASFPPGTFSQNYNAQSVYKDCSAVMAQLRGEYKETAMEMVDIELRRFDKMLEGVWAAAQAGDLNAVDRALAISRERRKMMGLDNPDRVQIDWRFQLADMLRNGAVRPEDVANEFGEEVLVEVNRYLLEEK